MEIEPSFIEASPELEYTEILLQICFTTTVLDHWNATCIINVFFSDQISRCDELYLHNLVPKKVISRVFFILFLFQNTMKQMHLS